MFQGVVTCVDAQAYMKTSVIPIWLSSEAEELVPCVFTVLYRVNVHVHNYEIISAVLITQNVYTFCCETED